MPTSHGRQSATDETPYFTDILQMLKPLETSLGYVEDILEMFEDIHEHGTRAHRERVPRRPELFHEIRDLLPEEHNRLIFRYEEYMNDVMHVWGEDRFRVGFALGAGISHFFQHPSTDDSNSQHNHPHDHDTDSNSQHDTDTDIPVLSTPAR
jgi:hypothetical protein